MKEYLLQKRDNLIIEKICNNARLSYNQIAKATKISKDSVRDRIKKMEKELFILSYFPLINYPKIGLQLFHAYIRLSSSAKANKNLLHNLGKINNIVSITWILGKYDLELQIISKNRKDAVKEIKNTISNIKELDILKSEELKFYSMGIETEKKSYNILENKKKIEIDSIDLKLISLLAKNARARIIDLSEELNLEEHQIRYRIKRLLSEKVILDFYTRTNKHRRGLNSYIMLLKINNKLPKEKIDEMQKIRNIYYFKNCKGKYQAIIRFYSENTKALISTILEIRTILEKETINFEIFPLLERHKFLPFSLPEKN